MHGEFFDGGRLVRRGARLKHQARVEGNVIVTPPPELPRRPALLFAIILLANLGVAFEFLRHVTAISGAADSIDNP